MLNEHENTSNSLENGMQNTANAVDNAASISNRASNHIKNAGKTAGSKAGTAAQAGSSTAASNTGGLMGGASAGATGTAASAAGGTATSTAGGTAASTAAGAAASSAGGAAAGTATGASAGAAAGSAVAPGAGTAVGAAAGTVVSVGIKPFAKAVAVFGILLIMLTMFVAALPSIVFRMVADKAKEVAGYVLSPITTSDTIEELADEAFSELDIQYNKAREDIKRLCAEEGYDLELTEANITDYASTSYSDSLLYIIAAYSASMENRFLGATASNMSNKLAGNDRLIEWDYVVKSQTKIIPLEIDVYEAVQETIVTDMRSKRSTYYQEKADKVSNTAGYRRPMYMPIEVEIVENGKVVNKTYYKKTNSFINYSPGRPALITEYEQVTVNELDGYESETIEVMKHTGTKMVTEPTLVPVVKEVATTIYDENGEQVEYTYLIADGEPEEKVPEEEEVEYLDVKIHPISRHQINVAFGIENTSKIVESTENPYLKASYSQMIKTFIETMNHALTAAGKTEYVRQYISGSGSPLSREDMQEYLSLLPPDTSATRRRIVETGLNLVGIVPYFMGGGHGGSMVHGGVTYRYDAHPGWNDDWNTPKPMIGNTKKQPYGTIWPYGLDCSGFTSWVYKTVFGGNPLGDSTTHNVLNYSKVIPESQIKPGDLYLYEGAGWDGHILMYIGEKDGKKLYVHAAGTDSGIKVSTYNPRPGMKYIRVTTIPESVLESDDTTMLGFVEIPEHYGVPMLDNSNADSTRYGWLSTVPNIPTGKRIETTHDFVVSYYCSCELCSGLSPDHAEYGKSSLGTPLKAGMIAASSTYMEDGGEIGFQGKIMTVSDRRGGEIQKYSNRIDIYVPDHETAMRMNSLGKEELRLHVFSGVKNYNQWKDNMYTGDEGSESSDYEPPIFNPAPTPFVP